MTEAEPTGIIKPVFDKLKRMIGYAVGEWTAEDGRHYVPTRNRRGAFAGFRRDPPRVRMSKKRRIALRRAARKAEA